MNIFGSVAFCKVLSSYLSIYRFITDIKCTFFEISIKSTKDVRIKKEEKCLGKQVEVEN